MPIDWDLSFATHKSLAASNPGRIDCRPVITLRAGCIVYRGTNQIQMRGLHLSRRIAAVA